MNENPKTILRDDASSPKSLPLRIALWLVRGALAASFLSAVADRFGYWGAPGDAGVVWGSVANYEAYVGTLNWFLPPTWIGPLGWAATIAEVVVAVGLLVGWKLPAFALGAALLLTTFAGTMLVALGPKPPLDYSVFTAVGAAFLLYAVTSERRVVV